MRHLLNFTANFYFPPKLLILLAHQYFYEIASIFTQFWDYVRQVKKFSMDTKFGDFILP